MSSFQPRPIRARAPWMAISLAAAAAVIAPASRARAQQAQAGRVQCMLFAGGNLRQVAGATVTISSGEATVSDRRGSAFLSAPPGTHTVRVEIPRAQLPEPPPDGAPGVAFEIADVPVVGGDLTRVFLALSARGELLDADVRAPAQGPELSVQPQAPAVPGALQAEPASGHTGSITGRVLSSAGGAPVAGAKVYVLGQPAEAQTGADGSYALTVPPGTYTLSVVHLDYTGQTLEGVTVGAGVESQLDIQLAPAPVDMEDYVVRARRLGGSVETVMEDRREAASVTDAIGAEDIARMPASDAAQAAQRVVGATIVGGRFVYVRGLGERYTNAQLNGAPLPSPEPDRSTVPLDLFPAQILQSLDIAKTFTPDAPADFAGGSVRIVTRAMPDKPMFSASLSLGANTRSTFKEVLAPGLGATDWLGFDDGARSMPAEVPDDYELNRNVEKPDGERVTSADLDEASLALNSRMSPRERVLLPSGSGSVLAGSSWKLGRDARLGALGSLVYRRKFSARREKLREYDSDPSAESGLKVRNRYDLDVASDDVRWGAFASAGLDLTENHRVLLLGMHSQLSDNDASLYLNGFNDNTQSQLSSNRLLFVSRSLDFAQLQGNHELPALHDATLQWNLSYAVARRDEPDRRDVVYQLNVGSERWSYLDGSESGRHFFAGQGELSRGAGIDWTQPVTTGDFATKIKLGSLVTFRSRELRARRFALRPIPRAPLEPRLCGVEYDPVGCPDALFADENIGTVLRVQEGTRDGDSYNAGLDVLAGYLMGDFGIGERIRIVAGARVEKTAQTLAPYDEFVDEELEDDRADLSRVDLLPAASIVYGFTPELALRLAGSRTLARPQLRELAPFAFSDYFNGIQVTGNPDLDLTTVLNGDLRLEYFPTSREVLAVSLFVKDFTDPIEPLIKPSSTTDVQAYENSPGALLYGVELEARKRLDFVGDALEDFTLVASLMLADSDIRVRQTGTNFLTNLERPLIHQAPYVVNLALNYENTARTQASVLYNVSGPTLVEIGVGGLDDAYLHPMHVVDLVASQGLDEHFRLKLSVENLLDARHLVTQGKEDRGDNLRHEYRTGVTASVGLSYTH